MKVLFTTNIPSPYTVNFLNELGKYCIVDAIIEDETSSTRNTSWLKYEFINFNGIFLKGGVKYKDFIFRPSITEYLSKREYDFVIIGNPLTPTGILALEYLKIKKIPYILHSEGGIAKSGVGMKEAFKRHLLSNAILYFSTTDIADNYFVIYGARKERIVRFPFTSLYERNIRRESITENEKKIIKERLGIKESKIIISVGRVIPSKGFDILLRALVKADLDSGVYIVGGQATPELQSILTSSNLKNVHFVDHLTTDKVTDYYLAADLFVLATRNDTWGLVINEAMAAGLPVITTDRCVAGMHLVEDFKNGFIVPVENEVLLADRIKQILTDMEMRVAMGAESLRRIRPFTFENWARSYYELLVKCKQ
jgi:glycosyltransferase involved in cell wall biosynthesis